MKKFIVALCALAMIAGAVSCKKDDPVDLVEDDPVVTEKLAEGIYQPAMKIASITTDIGDFEEWSWGAKNLDHITGRGEEAHSVTFGYAGDYVSKVIGNGEEWRYFYSSNQLSSSQLWVDNAKVIEMSFDHSADGKINSARIDIDESYLMQMLGGMIGGGGFPFANLLNRSAMESLAEMAKISAAVRNNAKFSVGSLNVGINFQWDGENVKNMMLNAGIAINIDTYSTAGAQFGYATLWTIPIMCILLIIAQGTASRMGAVTGKGFAALIRERFGIRWTAFAMLVLLIGNTSTTFSEFAGIASGMELFGVSKYISVPVAAVAV